MPFVPGLCPNCGAKLKIDSNQEAAVCEFCGTPFIVEKDINNNKITNITNIDNLHAEQVVINGQNKLEELIKSGETFIQFRDYLSAEKSFKNVTEEFPYDYRGWWGLIRAKSNDFNGYLENENEWEELQKIYNKAYSVADESVQGELREKFSQFERKLSDFKNSMRTNYNNEMQKIQNLQNQMNALSAEMDQLTNEIGKVKIVKENVGKKIYFWILGACGVLAVILAIFAASDGEFLSVIFSFVVCAMIAGLCALAYSILSAPILSLIKKKYVREIENLENKKRELNENYRMIKKNYDEEKYNIPQKFGWLKEVGA